MVAIMMMGGCASLSSPPAHTAAADTATDAAPAITNTPPAGPDARAGTDGQSSPGAVASAAGSSDPSSAGRVGLDS
ncbi:MAG: hypothetical protein ACO26I_02640, partial [Burkholderiaceae bacterium]